MVMRFKLCWHNQGIYVSVQVKSFRTKDELDKWLLDNPMRCPGALHLFERNAEEIRYDIEINSSSSFELGRQIEDPAFKFQVPLQYVVSREISRSLIRGSYCNLLCNE